MRRPQMTQMDSALSLSQCPNKLSQCLLQTSTDSCKPVAYASQSLTETERQYAQIEKGALSATWECENFSNFVLGWRI